MPSKNGEQIEKLAKSNMHYPWISPTTIAGDVVLRTFGSNSM